MRILLSFFIVLFTITGTQSVHAQRFGQRPLGSPLSPRSQITAPENVGQITGAERFLRGNRRRGDFVGADRNEGQSFVGSEQARTAGVIVSSTAGVEPPPDRSGQINRPLRTPGKNEMYLPRIRLDLESVEIESSTESVAPNITARVERAARLATQAPIAVSVSARTATLRGVVASESVRDLVEILVLFEPGISKVDNQLQTAARVP